MSSSADAVAALVAERLRIQREADAALVEAAGCLQEEGCQVWDPQPGQVWDPQPGHLYRWAESPDEHHERCPIALAAKIRSGG